MVKGRCDEQDRAGSVVLELTLGFGLCRGCGGYVER